MIKLRDVSERTIYGRKGRKLKCEKKNVVQKPWNEETVFRN